MRTYVEDLLSGRESGLTVPSAQVDAASDLAVGVTRFLTLRYRSGRGLPFAVEIGGTWLAASAQRTAINTEAKFLLLRHAFETWGVARVDLKSDARNEQSRAAIHRIGATFEGVLRQWQPSALDGEESLYRNTAMYSVVDAEWPAVREQLRAKLHR